MKSTPKLEEVLMKIFKVLTDNGLDEKEALEQLARMLEWYGNINNLLENEDDE